MKNIQPLFNSWWLTLFPRIAILPLLGMMLVSFQLQAQTISGKVTSGDNGDAMSGVSVVVKGTTRGAITTGDGSYSIPVSGDNPVLLFSFIGYGTQEVPVNGQSNINITLQPTDVVLDDVVITALGIARDKKALGYSVTEVNGEDLTQARENNVVLGLAGRVAGVNVTAPAGGPGGSSRVIIRGNTSLTADNQPLYVVDGLPLDNQTLGSAGMWGGSDGGDGISSLNPDDIETMSVLKGAAATALYGSRGQNGVIMITTKKGKSRSGIGVEYNGNFSAEDPQVLYDFQQEYGSGDRGVRPQNADEATDLSRSSWGAKLDGSPTVIFNGDMVPYSSNPDNMKNFYQTGKTLTNTVAFSGGTQDATFRFSASDLNNDGIIPNSGINRQTLSLRGSANLAKRVMVDVKANYVNEKTKNRPFLSDSPSNPGLNIVEMATNIPISALETYEDENGDYIWWNSSQYRTNPYWGVNRQSNLDDKQRLVGFASVTWQLTDWLSIMGRTGTDQYTRRRTTFDDKGTPYVPDGRMGENELNVRELNTDFMIRFDKNLSDAISLGVSVGGNQRQFKSESLSLNGSRFSIPGLQTVSNTENQTFSYGITEKQVNSMFAFANLGFNDYLFLDVTARNDWSSSLTLPDGSGTNSYFYPSTSLSFVLTDALNIQSDAITFGKVRVSYAEVGNDSNPYQLLPTYRISGQPVNGFPIGNISQGSIPNSELVPERTRTYEAGLDFRFFNNKLGLDFTWYKANTFNQIIQNTIDPTTGYGSAVINSGNIQNTGVEILLTATPVSSDNNGFRWDLSVNFAKNNNKIVSLNENDTTLKSIRLAESRQRNTYIEAQLGQPYAAIVGFAYQRDANDNIIHGDDGLPLKTDATEVLGVGVPDWTGGILNSFSFKGVTLSALVDMRFGGEIHSMTNLAAYGTGTHMETLNGREGGIVGEGVTETGEKNTVNVDAQDYYRHISTQISEEFIYDASFIKMRQMSLSYTFPKSLIGNTFIQGLQLSVVTRNPFFIMKNSPNIDPESNYSNGNGQGLEYGTIPTTRSIGFNINVKL